MTAGPMRDWTYEEAARRARHAGAAELAGHLARISLDRAANRIVTCTCSWAGNLYGWVDHIDGVVRGALRD